MQNVPSHAWPTEFGRPRSPDHKSRAPWLQEPLFDSSFIQSVCSEQILQNISQCCRCNADVLICCWTHLIRWPTMSSKYYIVYGMVKNNRDRQRRYILCMRMRIAHASRKSTHVKSLRQVLWFRYQAMGCTYDKIFRMRDANPIEVVSKTCVCTAISKTRIMYT